MTDLSAEAGVQSMRKRKLTIFSLLNLATVLLCLELWREGQPTPRMIVVALVSLPFINLFAWVGWRQATRR